MIEAEAKQCPLILFLNPVLSKRFLMHDLLGIEDPTVLGAANIQLSLQFIAFLLVVQARVRDSMSVPAALPCVLGQPRD